jgi:RNA polymerase sigma-70 factor (ECF subfamily)
MEGLSQQQAAGQLGWPLGTLQSRLARGRDRLRERLLRRGVAPSIAFVAGFLSAEAASAAVPAALATSTIRIALQLSAGEAAVASIASASTAYLTRGVLKAMLLHNIRTLMAATLVVSLTAACALGWTGHSPRTESPAPDVSTSIGDGEPETSEAMEVDPESFLDAEPDEEFEEDQKSTPRESSAVINEPLGDGTPDGKKSLGGSGEMIELGMPAGASRLTGVKIHGSRYGQAQPPKESFLIYFMSKDRKRILHTEMAPYSLFKRGPESWVEVKFDSAVEGLPKSFWLVLDFRAGQTKGVYVSFDTTTGGKFSRIGLPGLASSEVSFGGDWMIQGVFAE